MRPEMALHRATRDMGRAGPTLRRAQNDRRPYRPVGRTAAPGVDPNLVDPFEGGVERRRHFGVQDGRVATGDPDRVVAETAQHRVELRPWDAVEHRRIGDLEAVQMKDRQHGPVGDGVEELVRMPRRGERAGLGLAVAMMHATTRSGLSNAAP